MILPFRYWRRYSRIGGLVAVPLVVILTLKPDWGFFSSFLEFAAYAWIILLSGSGAVMAILRRKGIVEFSYSEEDKRGWGYRVQKQAEDLRQLRKRDRSEE